MSRSMVRVAVAAATGLVLTGAAASACTTVVTGKGRAANPMSFDPPQKYDMEAMARTRAVSDWQANVRKSCPQSSSSWSRSTVQKLECEGYAGGQECTATAIPANR